MKAGATFGAWLRRRRKALDLTQGSLAQRAGFSLSTIRKVEANELRPSRQLAEALAGALQLALEEHAAFVRFARDETPMPGPTGERSSPSAQPYSELPAQTTP